MKRVELIPFRGGRNPAINVVVLALQYDSVPLKNGLELRPGNDWAFMDSHNILASRKLVSLALQLV